MKYTNELPANWCVRRTKTNHKIINEWYCKKTNSVGGAWADTEAYFDNSASYKNRIKEGYTEIPFEMFERLILKKEITINYEIY